MDDNKIFKEIQVLCGKLHNSGFKANLTAIIGAELAGKSGEVTDALAPLVIRFMDEIQREKKSRNN